MVPRACARTGYRRSPPAHLCTYTRPQALSMWFLAGWPRAAPLALAVPSASMAKHFPTAQIVYNWCEEVKTEPKGELKAPITVGSWAAPALIRALRF